MLFEGFSMTKQAKFKMSFHFTSSLSVKIKSANSINLNRDSENSEDQHDSLIAHDPEITQELCSVLSKSDFA